MELNDELVTRKLASLREARSGTESWLHPSEIRHKGRIRRIRRRGGTIGLALVAVVLLATLVPIGLKDRTQPNATIHVAATLGPAIQLASDTGRGVSTPPGTFTGAVAQSEEQFSLSLLKQLSAAGASTSNTLISPSSLSTALSMLELGAKGDTQAQIAQALGSEGLTAQQQAAGWSALSSELALAGAADGISIESANSLWLQQGLAMDPSFMSSLSRYFASGVWQVDFAANPTGAIIALNHWVAQETHGHIATLFNPGAITNQTALILANAVYFKAAWSQPFTGTTSNASFYLPNGSATSVPFMHTPTNGPLDVSAYVGPGVDALQLPYKGGRMAALVIMPTSEGISDFTASLTQADLAQLVSKLASTTVDLAMPSLSMSSSNDLVPTMKGLGISDAFDPSTANFSGMTTTPLFVTDVVQKDTLNVDQWGSEASAATGIGMTTAARLAGMSMTINHPYLFLIRDTHSGQILFEAQVVNPRAG